MWLVLFIVSCCLSLCPLLLLHNIEAKHVYRRSDAEIKIIRRERLRLARNIRHERRMCRKGYRLEQRERVNSLLRDGIRLRTYPANIVPSAVRCHSSKTLGIKITYVLN